MGITQKSIDRLKRNDLLRPCNVLILGCQNMYTDDGNYGSLAADYFRQLGFDVTVWDITGCQGSEVVDLREPQTGQYDLILDHGTTEHCDGNYYQVNKNLYDLCKVRGHIVRENPKTGNWPGHGCNYLDERFYHVLCHHSSLRIVELTQEAAMGNVTDGWNVCCVMKKDNDNRFMHKRIFNILPVYEK